MDRRAEAGGARLSQQALLDLERSKVPPVELLDEVAQILGVNYRHVQATLFSAERDNKWAFSTASCAPKEEWILRWLLKRTGLSSPGGKNRASGEDCLRMRRDDRSWLLLFYLVHRVPGQALARVLIEIDYLPNLYACLRDADHSPGQVPATSDGSESASSISGSKTKKRKRDGPEEAVALEDDQSRLPDASSELLAASVCAAITHCMELSAENLDQITSEHMKIALTTSARIAASVTGRLISSYVNLLLQEPSEPLKASAMIEYAQGLLGVWEHRTRDDANTPEGEGNREFTEQCLSPCLAFLQVLRTTQATANYGQIVKKTERLIALHCLIPSRAKFLAQKRGRNEDIGGQTSTVEYFSVSGKLAPLLFDIAVRTVPRNTVRRLQQEQPWLEALFSNLVASCGDSGLPELLNVVIARKIALPRDELAKLALRKFSNPNTRWSLLVQILQIDASMFLQSSLPLMERLCDCIAESGKEEYSLIRDSVVITTMRAAAQTRELQRYVYMWHGRLAEEIQQDESIPQWRGSRVWQDPDVFEAFTDIIRTNAEPFLVHKWLSELLEHIEVFDINEEAMFAALAWVAIVSSLITSRAKDCAMEKRVLRQLQKATATAYAQFRSRTSQNWRLLRLVRQILDILPDEEEGLELLPSTDSSLEIGYPSLEHWRKMEDQSEATEYFHLLVCRAVARPGRYAVLLQEEFEHLGGLLQGLCDESISHPSSALADASLGIILQNPDILLIAPTETLWPALWRYAATRGSITSQRLFEVLVSSDTVTSNHVLLSQCFQAIQESVAGNEAHRSDFAYKILRSMPCQNIKRSQERTKLVKLLEDAGIGKVADDKDPAPSRPEDNPLFQELRSLASAIVTQPRGSLSILEADTFEHLCLALDHAKLKLDTPNQYEIDNLLSAITILTSPKSPTFERMPKNGPAAIYQRLCQLTSTLVTRFRKRLGGRYHLLLPVLQGLLRCLFRPIPLPTSSKHPQIRHHQPPWLPTNASPTTTTTSITTDPLPPNSATHFTRLLTSLCDPTASSVATKRSPSRRPTNTTGLGIGLGPLTDDTKKAKSIAGQYMQYLVIEYARCQLQGQLPPEVKAALMPGLYAVLDVMGRDVMRGMNAAMDSSQRAIFKGLYDDYVRFGRWDQN